MDKIARLSNTWKALLVVVLLSAIGLICYRFVLSLPLFWDDIFQFAWLDTVGWREIWTSPVPGLAYFRPLAFTAWKILHEVQGAYHDPILHAANLGLHVLNACLLAFVVTHMAPRRKTLTGLAAAVLFLLFPFSFQAVAPINSLMHPLAVAFILAAIATYQTSVDRTSPPTGLWLRLISILLAAASIFAHENGVLAPVLLTLTILCTQPRLPLKRLLLDVAPYWAVTFLCFIVWRNATGTGSPLSLAALTTQFESRLQNATYFIQALAYPVSFLARVVEPLLAQPNDLVAILLVCIPCLVAWAALAGYAQRGAYVAWGLGWFVLAALPACLLLSFNYVLESPRLLYLSSVGAAIFWSAPVSFTWQSRTANRITLALSALAMLAAGIWSYRYIQERAVLYDLLGQSITQLGQETQQYAPCGQGQRDSTLLVNFPAWFFVDQPAYLIGHDGIALISPGDDLQNLYRVNFGAAPAFATAALPDIAPVNSVYVAMGQKHTEDSLQPPLRAAGRVIANSAGDAGGHPHYAGCLQAEQQPAPAQYQALVDGRLALRAATLAVNPARDEIRVTLDWQALSQSGQDTTVFAQLLDASGQLIAQSDGYPLAGTTPIRLWQAGDIWRDVRYIRPMGGIPDGNYRVVVGAYLTQGAQRLLAVDSSGQRLQDDVVVIPH